MRTKTYAIPTYTYDTHMPYLYTENEGAEGNTSTRTGTHRINTIHIRAVAVSAYADLFHVPIAEEGERIGLSMSASRRAYGRQSSRWRHAEPTLKREGNVNRITAEMARCQRTTQVCNITHTTEAQHMR